MTAPALVVAEHQQVAAPPELLRDGRLDVYAEVLDRDLFQVSVTSKGVRIQARSHIGLIPLNDRLSLHVVPRVPLANLDRLLAITSHVGLVLDRFVRDYDTGGAIYPSLVGLYARSLRAQIERLAADGLLRRYQRCTVDFAAPRGRVDVSRTVQLSLPRGTPGVSSVYFERTADTPENRLLLAAVRWLDDYARSVSRSLALVEKIAIARDLNAAWHLLSAVTYDRRHRFLEDPVVAGREPLSTRYAAYRPVLDFAASLLRGQAIVIERPGGPVPLPTLLVHMDAVFEGYVREVLARAAVRDTWPERVLDGNRMAPAGGQRSLFQGPEDDEVPMKPDVVLFRPDVRTTTAYPVVIDAKYKPVNNSRIDRSHLEQLMLYALGYGAAHVVVVQPSVEATAQGLRRAGAVGAVTAYVYGFDLAGNLPAQEAAFADDVRRLAASVP